MESINRIKDARFHTLASALDQAVGTTIEGIENLRVNKVDQRKTGVGKQNNKPYSFQNLHVSDRGDRSVVQVWNFPDLSSLEGGIINLESTFGKDSEVYGVMVDEYKNERRIKLSESGLIDNIEDAKTSPENQWQNIEAHSGNKGGNNDRRQDNRRGNDRRRDDRQEEPPRSRGGSPTRGPSDRHEKKPIFGATVGMAINQAVAIIRESPDSGGNKPDMNYFLSRQFSQDAYTIASDILRIAERLERGDIAPSAKQREEASRSVEYRQPQSRSEQRAAARQARDEPPSVEYANEDASEERGPITDSSLADDDIPF